MTQDRRHLIDDLVGDLRPVTRAGRIGPSLAVWLTLATAYSVLIVAATGPWRPGAFSALLLYPAFAGETALAIVAIVAVAVAAVRSAIPGEPRRALCFRWALPPLIAWAAIYVIGFWYPAHPASTLGGRGTCHWEIVLFSLPTLGLLLWLARRLFPLWPRATGLLAGAAAAAIPAELMQFGCMYELGHILTHHLAPIVVTGALGALIGPLALRVRSAVPRRRDVSIH